MDLWWIYLCVYGFPIMLLAFLGLVVAWIIWEKWITPKEAKEIRYAKRKRRPLVIHVGDEGYAKFDTLNIIEKEGFAATTKKESEDQFLGFFARSTEEVETEEVETKDEGKESKAAKIANLINQLATKKTYLRDAKIPVWFAYTGKAIFTSLYSLAGLEAAKQLGNPTLTFVDLQEIKKYLPKPWDQTLIRTGRRVAKQEGIFEQKKFSGAEGWKALVVPVGIIMALIMGVIVLSVVFLR